MCDNMGWSMRWEKHRSDFSQGLDVDASIYQNTRDAFRMKMLFSLTKCHYCGVTLGSRTSHIRAERETPTSCRSRRRSWRIRGCRCMSAPATGSNISRNLRSIPCGTSRVYRRKCCIAPYSWLCLVPPVQPERESLSHTERL